MGNLEIAIGEKIKSYRKKREITQEQLAEYLNISFQSVSKWECGDAYPDITTLPKIAVFFGITTDELLGVDKQKEQWEINEYINRKITALIEGDPKQAVAQMREANAKYPGRFDIMERLAKVLHIYASSEPDEENKHNAYKEIISLDEKIRAECKDDKIRRNALKYMCIAYKNIGENDKAIELARNNFNDNIFDSDAFVFTQLLENGELLEQQQKNMIEFARGSFMEMQRLSKDLDPEYRLRVYKNILDIYFTIFKDGDFYFYNLELPDLYMNIAETYMEQKNNEKALENIKNAADCAIAFDKTAFSAPFTSPLVNKIPSVGLRFWKNYKGNQAYVFSQKLNDEKYTVLRDTHEFKKICENLIIYADVNG